MKNYVKRCLVLLLSLCLAGAMALPAFAAKSPVELFIAGYKTREVVNYEYTFEQSVGPDGIPAGIPQGGQITITVRAADDNHDLFDWMTEKTLKKDGKIVISDQTSGKVVKTIMFRNAYCVDYNENWKEKTQHTETIVISCQEFTGERANYTSNWASTFSEGNLTIIIACATVILLAAAVSVVIVVRRKNKTSEVKTSEPDII